MVAQRRHDAVLDVDLDVQLGRLLRVHRRIGGFATEDELLLGQNTVAHDSSGEDLSLRGEAAPLGPAEVVELDDFRTGQSSFEPTDQSTLAVDVVRRNILVPQRDTLPA